MNKVLLALCAVAAVALADVGSTCDNGVPLALQELYEGDTSVCDRSSIQCQNFKYSPRGMWFTYTGQGKAVLLDTCDQRTSMDSVIFVFDSCNQAGGFINSCVAMDDDGCNHRQSRVMFTAESMHVYHIFVTGYQESNGTFYLATSEVLPPNNYKCNKAMSVGNFPFSVEGETGTCLAVQDTCQNTFSSGLWYKVQGSGQSFVAHTCNQNTNYDSVVAVFSECNETTGDVDGCVTYNNDACYRSSLVTWHSVQNSEYWVFVTGFHNARGRFTLAIEQRSMNPYSHCYEPIVITQLPFYFAGQTDYLETTFSECRHAADQHSLYFRMQGYGRKVIATTCTSSSTVNDSVIDVYTDCVPQSSTENPGSGKNCVASNDDYCGLGASVVFYAGAQSYYIAVSSASPTIEGVSFNLAVSLYEETVNSQCWFAEEIDSFPDVMLGNTTNMDPCEQTCDGSKIARRGGWFRYTHNGPDMTITASTCNPYNILDAKIEVYRNCNEMACIVQAAPTNGCTNATFVAQDGRTYNFFITAADPSNPGGYFHVDFFEAVPSTHATCEEAYFVNRGALPYRLEDNTITADFSHSDCSNKSKKGIWVAVIGTGNKIVATTCDSHTGYDTYLELYNHCPDEGEYHPEYCMKFNDDTPGCSRSAQLEWESQKGAWYWVFVTGFASNTGIFVLKIYEKTSMINAKCQTAVGIRSLPYYDYGLTTYCDMTNASCTPNPRKGNWYELVGNDHWITISTCFTETDYATEVEVYLGCSENGGEICVNHNHDTECSPKTQITFAAQKDQLFFIFITGVDDAVMSEGFFGMSVIEGEKLPEHMSSSDQGEGLSGFEIFMVCVGVLMGCGAIAAGCAVGYGVYKRRHVSYQEISSSD